MPAYTPILATLGYVLSPDRTRVLLIHRNARPDDPAFGKYNGLGGKMEPGEDVATCMRRELREEAGIDVPGLRLRGVVHETGLLGHDYVVFFFVGEVADAALRPAPGVELAWHDLPGVRELPLVDDLPLLLDALLANPEPVLAVERYDGTDRRLAFAFDGEPPSVAGGSA